MGTIIVIDDSPTVVKTVRAALKAHGHQVDGVESVVNLPARLRSDPPDLILLDLEMPFLSGQAVGQFIRRMQPHPIPILIHSSRPPEELREAARSVGAAGVVPKGDPELLCERVVAALARAESEAC